MSLPHRGRWSLAWGGFLALLILIAVAVEYAEPVRDGDLFWQMAYGRYFLQQRTLLPDDTIFSWTPADSGAIYCAWIPQILLYLIHQAGGLTPLFALRYLCLLIFVASVFWLARRMKVARHPLVGLVALLGVFMSESAAYIKPEIFSYVLTVAAA
ncbi:MAG: hypothetical protein V1774_05355, partial [Candidatus Eisenbacteria bacterium]